MAILPTNAGFNVVFEEVTLTDKVFYETENKKITQLLSNDQYLKESLDGFQAKYPVGITLNHNLNRYPMVQILQVEYGAGLGGAGEVPAGGDNISSYARFTHVSKNEIQIHLTEKLVNPVFHLVNENTYTLVSDDEVISYEILLF